MALTGSLVRHAEELLHRTEALFLSFGAVGLFLLAFIESVFFPIPPDVVLIPLSLSQPSFALFYAAVATIGSVAGAGVGYWIGYRGGRPALERMVSEQNISRVERYYEEYGILAVGIAGFTPVPYKVFTLSSGAFSLDVKGFLAVSVISRGARFFLEAALLMLYGETIVSFLESLFGAITLVVAVLAAAAYVMWKRYW